MKKAILLLFLPCILMAQEIKAQPSNLDWQYNLDTAIEKAKEQDKKVLVYFTGSDWCAPCKMLKKDLFETTEFKNVSDNYIWVYIDMPRNQDLLTPDQLSYNKQIVSKQNKRKVFPLFQVLNKKGKVLDEYSGYAMNGDIRYHMQLLKKYL